MQFLRHSCLWFCLNAIGLYVALFSIVRADIVTDGTVGPAQTLNGPAFIIPENLGSRAGANLFHSFHQFNIGAGEQATFTGSSSIANVISRVTGGHESVINGLLRSTVGQADFYLINPAGIVMGANAQIDVPASFYVSTADQLKFPDGSTYSAVNPSASTLNIDQPESFGFLGDRTSTITIEQNSLVLSPGRTLSLSAGGLVIDDAQLAVDHGEVQLISIGDTETVVTIDGELSVPAEGSLAISNSTIDVAGDGAGRLIVRGGKSTISTSQLFADNVGPTTPLPGKGIDIQAESLTIANSLIAADILAQGQQGANVRITTANELSIVDGALISSSTFAAGDITGRAGDINVNAGELIIDSQGGDSVTGIVSQASDDFMGDAGNVDVRVKESISLLDGGIISSSSFGKGDAGNVIINARTMTIDGQQSRFSTGVFNDVISPFPGNPRSVTVTVDDSLSILDGGSIRSRTSGASNAVTINVNAGSLTIDSRGSNIVTSIESDANPGATGMAGIVNVIVADTLSIFGDGTISTNTLGIGDAGEVNVSANQVTLNGKGGQIQAAISSNAFPGSVGDAGSVTVMAKDSLSLVSGSQISSSTFEEGNGGAVSIEAGVLLIDGQGRTVDTGITSGTEPGSRGNAGSVSVNVDNALTIVNEGLISSNTQGAGRAGNVNVDAGRLILGGGGGLRNTGIASAALTNSSGQAGNIAVSTGTLALSDGAVISIESLPTLDNIDLGLIEPAKINIAAQNIRLSNSSITTESFGNVPAGSITLNVAGTLSLDPSTISTTANNADGGPISIQAKVLDLQDSQITTSVTGQGDGGDINLTAKAVVLDSGFIQANTAGANARGGDIRINTDALVASHNRLLRGGDRPLAFQSGLNVIQAAAPEGVSGDINISSPQLDISGELIDLDFALLDVDDLAQDPCTTPGGRQSSLSSVGRGGLPESPEQAGSVVVGPERLKRLLQATEKLRGPQSGLIIPVARDHGEPKVKLTRIFPECQP